MGGGVGGWSVRDTVSAISGGSGVARMTSAETTFDSDSSGTPPGHMLTGQPGMVQAAQGAGPRSSVALTAAAGCCCSGARVAGGSPAPRQCESLARRGAAVKPEERATRIRRRPKPIIEFRIRIERESAYEDSITIPLTRHPRPCQLHEVLTRYGDRGNVSPVSLVGDPQGSRV